MNSPAISSDSAWIEVIHKMDAAYADLVRYQVELEQKNAALEDAQRFIASVQAAMTDVLIVCDARGVVLQVNQALLDLLATPEAALIGAPLPELFAPAYRGQVAECLHQMHKTPVSDRELALNGPQEAIPVAMNCSPRRDRRGRLVGHVLVGRPVGELRKAYESLHKAHAELQDAQQRLVNSEKMASLGRLVAGVAHELNNPISFVYGNMFALQRYGQRLTRYLDAIHHNAPAAERARLREELRIDKLLADLESLVRGTLEGAERVRAIVEDLRRFSTGKQGEYAPLNLTPLVSTAVRWVVKGNRTEVETVIDLPETLTVRGHAGQIHQVLMNLIQNALDAMRDSPVQRLEIIGGTQAGGAWLDVRDTGHGIAPEHLLHVFDPFFTTKPVGQGTGLGLSISFRTVSEHGGRLEAANRPDGGAVFRLQLPT